MIHEHVRLIRELVGLARYVRPRLANGGPMIRWQQANSAYHRAQTV
jgi:hypothetical protein